MLASKETNKPVHQLGESPTTVSSLPTGNPTHIQNKLAYSGGKSHTWRRNATISSLQQGPPNKLAYSGEKAANREEIKLLAVNTRVTYPALRSPSAPKCL